MKRSLITLACMAGLISAPTYAYDNYNLFPGEANVQRCYGLAMVGMDSVINSRLGVPVEHAVELARIRGRNLPVAETEQFSTELLDSMLNAYLWDGSPHSYAIRVFYRCAQNTAPLHSAASEVPAVESP